MDRKWGDEFGPEFVDTVEAVLVSISETGTGEDSLSGIDAGLSLSDTSTGEDSLSGILAGVGLHDSGSGSESIGNAVSLSVTDSSVAVDSAVAFDLNRYIVISDESVGVDDAGGLEVTTPEAWVPDILAFVPGCPEFMAERQIKMAADEFCRRTLTWQYSHANISLVAGQGEYTISTPVDSVLVDLLSVFRDDTLLTPTETQYLDRNYSGWMEETGYPAYYYLASKTILRVVPIPDESDGELIILMALAPPRYAASLPDYLAEEHFETIKHGALARIAAIPGKQWSRLTDPREHMKIFKNGISRAKYDRLVNPGFTGLTQQDYFS